MKISDVESSRAAANSAVPDARILPKGARKGLRSSKPDASKRPSPLEHGMAVAEAALAGVPDTREELVQELKERVRKGEYDIAADEVADMMLRRLGADRIR